MVMSMVKTTVLLRDDVYSLIISEFGKRELSNTINKILSEKFFREKKDDCFGLLAGKMAPFEREHEEDRF